VLDESTDTTDCTTANSYPCWTAHFQCHAELLGLAILKEKHVKLTFLLPFRRSIWKQTWICKILETVCIDIMGGKRGFVALLQKELSNPDGLISFHWILHQQNLCTKSGMLKDTLGKVVATGNYVHANA
jgi:hypothetical protein